MRQNRSAEDFEDSYRARPNPKGNRPRTKQRPRHESALKGMVVGVHVARYLVRLDDSSLPVLATLAKELRAERAVVGDWVRLTGDTSGVEGSLARIVAIDPRRSLLSRSMEDSKRRTKPIVANADQLAIIMAATNPEPRVGLVDRYLAAAYQAGIQPLVVVTKCDLKSPSEFLSNFKSLELRIFEISKTRDLPEALIEQLRSKTTVLAGPSGAGKSTLMNRLIPNASLSEGLVNQVTGRGKHTSSAAVALELPGQRGWLIDTPGVRSFGLGHLQLGDLMKSHPDLQNVLSDCPKGCSHREDAEDCALEIAEQQGEISTDRIASLRRIIAAVSRDHWEE